MDQYNNNGRDMEVSAGFQMPQDCAFRSTPCRDARCGSCMYYSTVGWSGYCDYHERETSSTNYACGYYE